LIVGSKDRAKNAILSINAHKETGYRVIGCLEIDDSEVGKEVIAGVKIIGTLKNIQDIIFREVIDGVVFAIPLREFSDPRPYLIAAEEVGIDIAYLPDLYLNRLTYRPITGRIQLQPLFGNFAITVSSMIPNSNARLIKTVIDYLAASIGLLLLSPLFAIIAIAIKVSSQGPVFYTQERSGLNGRAFMLYKFRTMIADAENKIEELETLNESDGPVFKIRNDPRIIPGLGYFLRKTSLDELPQLINIFRGEMSLVGPRPPIPAEVTKYKPWQRRRLSMRPGLTCIWQTSPHRNDISFNEWMKLDLEYIDSWSLWLDMKLLLKTFKVVVLGDGR